MNADSDALWSRAKPDAAGLVTAVVQHADTGAILMVGMMNRESFALSVASGFVTFFSRSRNRLWKKGEESGNTLTLVELRIDCDGDAVLVQARPAGPTCHTGRASCFYSVAAEDVGWRDDVDAGIELPLRVLGRVTQVIEDRKRGLVTQSEGRSYVRELLREGPDAIAAKVREEAEELATALTSESDERVASEAADLIFHAMVGLAARDLDLGVVCRELARRFGTSGVDEKAARGR